MKIDVQQHPRYARAHHAAGGGFHNIWHQHNQPAALKAIPWFISRAFSRPTEPLPPFHATDTDALRVPPERLRITWIGHSTLLIQTPGLTLLTDPQFSDRASPFRFAGPDRKPPLPITIEDLPRVDIVLLSHDHYDHLDERSIRQMERHCSPLFLAPLGVADIVRNWGASRVVEMDWWQYAEIDGVRFNCTPARHFSGRGLTGRNATLWAGWYVEAPAAGLRLYYTGDSGYAPLFEQIREQFGAPEVALIPIGAYLPRWLMEPVHLDPEEAVQAFLDLQAAHFIPIHWGTFDLAEEWITDPLEAVREQAAEKGVMERLRPLVIGESLAL